MAGQSTRADRTGSEARTGRWGYRAALGLLLLLAGVMMLGAAKRTSTTFDELTMVALGARGYETGAFDLMPQHPPGAQFLYGLPVFLSAPAYPDESLASSATRYEYARDFYWRLNDPERITLLSRLPAIAAALALVVLVFHIGAQVADARTGLLAAILVAFLPDVLGHGAVAYSDVPMAVAYLLAVWALDRSIRDPGIRTGTVAGAACALALGIKFSAVALAPVAALLLLAEAANREGGDPWHARLLPSALAALASLYLVLVAMYGGDLLLRDFWSGMYFTFGHVTDGHDHPAYLFGRTSLQGWWYFYPVVFFLKTPLALHLLIASLVVAWRPSGLTWREHVDAPTRALTAGGTIFALALLASNLNIGFRYALPLLPLVCILIAAAAMRVADRSRARVRIGIWVLAAAYAVSSLSFYPHFLAYTSEYIPDADRGHEVLVDSNLDWGQGLLDLRSWMRNNNVTQVYLSYFGSALPAGYGIAYTPLPSYLELEPATPDPAASPPDYVVISATNLHGVYLPGDPFAKYRERSPAAVLAHSLLVFDVD